MAPAPFQWGLLPRRFQFLLAFVVFFLITIFTLGPPSPSSVPTVEQVKDAVKNPHIPHVPLPSIPEILDFGAQPAHKPPKQAGNNVTSEYGLIEWLNDFKWRNPLSSVTTQDEDTAVLPPLKERPPIFTYYEAKPKQGKALKEAEHRMILAWRRAWWAQGFRPQVLALKDAQGHPMYDIVQRMKLAPNVEMEIMRWLAWGQMNGGILASSLAFPMAEHDNSMLAFLRRGEYPELSRVETLHNGVFFGEGSSVNDAIGKAINHKMLQNATANSDKIAQLSKHEGGVVVNLLDKKAVAVDKKANGIAYYSTFVLSSKYGGKYRAIAEKMTNTTSIEGRELLATLINSHLHLNFQETYPEGFAVVKPLPEHTTALMYEAIDISRNLTQCPASPMPKSCPPNRQSCKPCDPTKPAKLELVQHLSNSTKKYQIGTVPHPYTLTSLHYTRDSFDADFIRTGTQRNIWINDVTKETAVGKSENYRVVDFKDAVAAPESAHHSLWLTAEVVTQDDLDWVLGFSLPQKSSSSSAKTDSNTSAPSDIIKYTPRPGMPSPIPKVDIPEERWIKNEEERLIKARDILKSKDQAVLSTVRAAEAWSTADAEAWKFARAFSARRKKQRVEWEEAEARYAGSEKKAGVRPAAAGGRWND